MSVCLFDLPELMRRFAWINVRAVVRHLKYPKQYQFKLPHCSQFSLITAMTEPLRGGVLMGSDSNTHCHTGQHLMVRERGRAQRQRRYRDGWENRTTCTVIYIPTTAHQSGFLSKCCVAGCPCGTHLWSGCQWEHPPAVSWQPEEDYERHSGRVRHT